MSNTLKRVLSAIVMIGGLLLIISGGRRWVDALLLVLGVLVIDEFLITLLRLQRMQLRYLSAQILFVGGFFFFVFLDPAITFIKFFNNAALVNNILLLFYLFYIQQKELINILQKMPYLVALYLLFPFISLAFLVSGPYWHSLLLVLFLVNFGMDTGAWLVGKKFGRHKLWPAISPNKTVEGFMGGVLLAALAGTLGWFVAFKQVGFALFLLFAALGILSQLGDLVQSKLKRQCAVKDSSHLIPGHGGVYDRLDSLIFVAPFFVLLVDYFL